MVHSCGRVWYFACYTISALTANLSRWLALFATFGYLSSFGVYQDLYTLAGTASSSNVSWIGSTQLFLFVAVGLPAGSLLDKGYFKHVIYVGSLIYVFRFVP